MLPGFLQLAFFNVHVFEFAGVEYIAALQAFDEFSIFFARDYAHTRVLAFDQIVSHRMRLGRAGADVIDPGLASRAQVAPSRLAPELAVFLVRKVAIVKHK